MKKKLLQFTTIVIIMLIGACSNEDLLNENDKELLPEANVENARKISLTANLPHENPTTRVSLNQENDLTITLKWEADDELQVVFVQNTSKIKSIAKVVNISADKKRAQLDIAIPDGINTDELFNLYGVYGGGGLSEINPTHAILPSNTGDVTSLDGEENTSVWKRNDVMFYFVYKNMEAIDQHASVTFKHLGSLVNITIKNTNTNYFGDKTLKHLQELRLVGVGGNDKWSYNFGEGGGSYDLMTGEFQNTETAGNYIYFKSPLTPIHLNSGEEMTFWAWIPPLSDVTIPELKLELRYPETEANRLITTSDNSKPARIIATDAGKSYYFYATWNGLQLEFTDQEFTPPSITPTELSVENWSEGVNESWNGVLFEGDFKATNEARRLSNLWDRVAGDGPCWFESYAAPSNLPTLPYSFSIDLGENQNLKLTHIKIFHLSDPPFKIYTNYALKTWQIYGSNTPSEDGSWDSWTKIADCESIKPSGTAKDSYSDIDEEIAPLGEVYKFSEPYTAYRYIRFKVIDTWDGGSRGKIRLDEVVLYGIKETSLTIDVTLPSTN